MLPGIFDVMGPVMIGPSSSHTAGVVRIGRIAREIFGEEPGAILVSFAGTLGRKAGPLRSDLAIIAGFLGYDTDDPRMNDALEIAQKRGMTLGFETACFENAHPATVEIAMKSKDMKKKMDVTCVPAGGGRILVTEIDGCEVCVSGNRYSLLVIHEDTQNTSSEIVGILSSRKVAFSIGGVFRKRGMTSLTINTARLVSNKVRKEISRVNGVRGVYAIRPIFGELKPIAPLFSTVRELTNLAMSGNCEISDVVIDQEAERYRVTTKDLFTRMRKMLRLMRRAIDEAQTEPRASIGGLVGGEASLLRKKLEAGCSISGKTVMTAAIKALGMMETNASRGRVVAAPTGGACGVIPGALLAAAERLNSSEERIVRALFTAGGIGMTIADRVPLSGSVAGCQAECGAASGMAAGAIVELGGGTVEQVGHAAAIALKNCLGLVCDPVAGLVEVPCQKRNALMAVNALAAADMALAGIRSVVPIDEVISALKEIGTLLPKELKGTALGGLANTASGTRIRERIEEKGEKRNTE